MVEDRDSSFWHHGIIRFDSSCDENRKAELYCDAQTIKHSFCGHYRLVLFSGTLFQIKAFNFTIYDIWFLSSGNGIILPASIKQLICIRISTRLSSLDVVAKTQFLNLESKKQAGMKI